MIQHPPSEREGVEKYHLRERVSRILYTRHTKNLTIVFYQFYIIVNSVVQNLVVTDNNFFEYLQETFSATR